MLLAGEEFKNYGPSHLAALVVFGAGAVAVVAIGRRHRDSGAARRFSRSWALAIPVFAVPLQMLQFLPSDWDFDTSLPLQLCDLAWMAAVWALWTHRPWAIGLTYFWGLTLTTQAIVTPALAQDFPTPRYFMYWGMHFVIVWAAIYLVWGLRLTPTWRVYRTAVAVTAGWAVCIFTFNSIVGSNYGFLNRFTQAHDGPGVRSRLGNQLTRGRVIPPCPYDWSPYCSHLRWPAARRPTPNQARMAPDRATRRLPTRLPPPRSP